MRTALTTILFLALAVTGAPVLAKGKGGGGVKPPPPGTAVNACGCYRDAQGACYCPKRGKCDCPGDCEPVGCEAKRQAEAKKIEAAEMKKAAEADKKQREAEARGESTMQKGDDEGGGKGKGKGKGKADSKADKKKGDEPSPAMPAFEKKGAAKKTPAAEPSP